MRGAARCAAVLVALGAAGPALAQSAWPPPAPPSAVDRVPAFMPREFKAVTPVPPPARPAEVWVPERRVYSPEAGRQVVVPGHWERRISDERVAVPPLAVTPLSATGAPEAVPVTVPAGERPPAADRQGP